MDVYTLTRSLINSGVLLTDDINRAGEGSQGLEGPDGDNFRQDSPGRGGLMERWT